MPKLTPLHDVLTRPADFDQQDAVYGCPKIAVPLFWVRHFVLWFFLQKMQHAMQLLQQRMLSCGEILLLCNDSDSGTFHTFKFL